MRTACGQIAEARGLVSVLGGMLPLLGIQVVEAARWPKMQLSADCPVTDEFRAEMNAWMAEFFGYESAVPDYGVTMVGNTIFASRETINLFNNLIA